MTQKEIDNILKAARQLGYVVKKTGDDVFLVVYPDGDFDDDVSIEEIASVVDSPPKGWVERRFGPYPPLKKDDQGAFIPIEKGGFNWAVFDDFNKWIIQQEGLVVDAPEYFTGDDAYKQAEKAKDDAEEASRGVGHRGDDGPIQQEWEIVGVPGPEQAYYIQPVDPTLPPERLIRTKTLEGGQIEYEYGHTDAQGNTKTTRYEYSAAPGAPASTYLGIRTKINPSTKKPYTFHATGYLDENDDEKYTRIDLIPEEDPERKFLGKQIIGGEEYYAWGYIGSDDNPVVLDAERVRAEDPTETLLSTEGGVETWGHKDPVTGDETITRTDVAPVPRDPAQEYFGRGADAQGREYDIYGHWDPATGRKVITGRQYLQDIEPDEVFLGTVDDGGWRIDQYGYIDPDTGSTVVTRRQSREPIRDPILSMDDMIAQALGKVDDWSDLSDPNLQRAQSLFDFKRQPTDAERLRLAMDIAQSPSDYMTLVGLYTGAVSRESPARAGERMAPLAPYLQQMAQKFFLDVPGINEMAPRRQPAQPTQPTQPTLPTQPAQPAAITPSVTPTPTTAITAPSSVSTAQAPFSVDQANVIPQESDAELLIMEREARANLMSKISSMPSSPEKTALINNYLMEWPSEDSQMSTPAILQAAEPSDISAIAAPSGAGTTQMPVSFNPATATSSLPFYYQQQNKVPDTEVLAPPAIDDPNLSADPEFLEKMYGGKYPIATGVEKGTYSSNEHLMIPSYQQGGIVPGPIGAPKIIQAHGGEMVIPNPIKGEGMVPEDGVWRPTAREFSKWVVKPGTKGLIPSQKESAIRFRSPHTIRYMTPTQRMLFQEDVERTFDRVPYEDWRMQEMLSTGAVGSPGRPRARFRSPSFVRG